MDGPVKTLAQLFLWRLEIEVITSVVVGIGSVVCIGAGAIWGPDGVEVAICGLLGLAVVVTLWAIIRAVVRAFTWDRVDPTAECRHQAAVWASRQ